MCHSLEVEHWAFVAYRVHIWILRIKLGLHRGAFLRRTTMETFVRNFPSPRPSSYTCSRVDLYRLSVDRTWMSRENAVKSTFAPLGKVCWSSPTTHQSTLGMDAHFVSAKQVRGVQPKSRLPILLREKDMEHDRRSVAKPKPEIDHPTT